MMTKAAHILIILAFMTLLWSCGSQPVTVAVNEVCGQSDKKWVSVEGYLRLRQSSDQETASAAANRYNLLLVEKGSGTGAFIAVSVPGSGTNTPNNIDELPISYTYNDLHINTDSGKQVAATDKIIVTGEISKETRPCFLRVDKIESSPVSK